LVSPVGFWVRHVATVSERQEKKKVETRTTLERIKRIATEPITMYLTAIGTGRRVSPVALVLAPDFPSPKS
jgi:hypothetical protein